MKFGIVTSTLRRTVPALVLLSAVAPNWDQIMTRSIGALTGLATLLLAVQQLR